MGENSEDCCEILSLKQPKQAVASVVCSMKVPNFFSLEEYEESFDLCSSPFDFALATWCFRFSSYNNGYEYDINRYKRFAVHMVRLSSETSCQKIFSSTILTDSEAKFHHTESMNFNFNKNDRKLMSVFSDVTTWTGDILNVIIHLISAETEAVVAEQVTDVPHRGVSLRQDLKNVLLNGQDHNITFDVRGKKIKAHRDILQARSEVFHSMLSQDILEKNNGVIDVPDCDPQAFELFLFHVYTGETKELNEKNMFGLYYVADKYSFTQLRGECCAFIKNYLSETNICDAVQLASKHGDEGLMDFAMKYFTTNADVVWPSAEWQSFVKENYILANDFITKAFKKSRDRTAKRLKTS